MYDFSENIITFCLLDFCFVCFFSFYFVLHTSVIPFSLPKPTLENKGDSGEVRRGGGAVGAGEVGGVVGGVGG